MRLSPSFASHTLELSTKSLSKYSPLVSPHLGCSTVQSSFLGSPRPTWPPWSQLSYASDSDAPPSFRIITCRTICFRELLVTFRDSLWSTLRTQVCTWWPSFHQLVKSERLTPSSKAFWNIVMSTRVHDWTQNYGFSSPSSTNVLLVPFSSRSPCLLVLVLVSSYT